MSWSFHIAKISGIDVRMHATFLLLLGWIAFLYGKQGGLWAAAAGVTFVLLIFLCVLLHEFGHAIAARRYGIATPEITLLPIGGVARLERMPENPREEIFVALAGPAVNVAIAALLWGFIELTGGFPTSAQSADLPVRLLGVNLWLVAFNMIPAFPMDGGRVLRALLALRTSYVKATNVAAGVGQAIALVFGFFGLTGNPILLLIALFVYFGAAGEAAMARVKNLSEGLRVDEAMITHFQPLPLQATLGEAADALVHGSQHAFPVVDESGALRGMLTQEDMVSGLHRSGAQTPVAEVMRMDVPALLDGTGFEAATVLMRENDCPALPVLDSSGHLVGLLTPENVAELLQVRDALAAAPPSARPEKLSPG